MGPTLPVVIAHRGKGEKSVNQRPVFILECYVKSAGGRTAHEEFVAGIINDT
jgi:hypothetical protein